MCLWKALTRTRRNADSQVNLEGGFSNRSRAASCFTQHSDIYNNKLRSFYFFYCNFIAVFMTSTGVTLYSCIKAKQQLTFYLRTPAGGHLQTFHCLHCNWRARNVAGKQQSPAALSHAIMKYQIYLKNHSLNYDRQLLLMILSNQRHDDVWLDKRLKHSAKRMFATIQHLESRQWKKKRDNN